MNDNIQPNTNNFFQQNFEEMPFSRSMSFCSFFSPEQKGAFDLGLEIEEVVEFNDVELQNYRIPFFDEEIGGDDLWIGGENQGEEVAVSVEDENQSSKVLGDRPDEGERAVEEAGQGKKGKGKLAKSANLPKVQKNFPDLLKKKEKKEKVQKPAKTFYEKNICRNIVRKMIRAIDAENYKERLLYFCKDNEEFYGEFREIMASHLEMITGPTALKEFLLVEDDVSKVLKRFTRWYLKERYLRDAMNGGQMDNVDKYVEYKNKVLLPLLDKL